MQSLELSRMRYATNKLTCRHQRQASTLLDNGDISVITKVVVASIKDPIQDG